MASTEEDVSVEKSANEETPVTLDVKAESSIKVLDSFPEENEDDLSGVQGDEDEEEELGESSVQVEKERNTDEGTLPIPPEEQETGEKQTETGEKPTETGDKQTETGDKQTETGEKQTETGEKQTSEEIGGDGIGDEDISVVERVEENVEQSEELPVSGLNAGGDGLSADDAGMGDKDVALAEGIGESVEPSEESAVSEPSTGDVTDANDAAVKESDAGKIEEGAVLGEENAEEEAVLGEEKADKETVLGEEKEESQVDDEGQVESFEDETVKVSDPPPEVTEEAGDSNVPEEDKSEEVPTESDLLKDTPTEGEDIEPQLGDDDDDALLEMEEGEENDEIEKNDEIAKNDEVERTDEASNNTKEEEKEDKSRSDDLDGEGVMEKWNLDGEIEGDGDDGFQEAVGDDEPMETDEFDELENAIKRQSENKTTKEDADESSKSKEDSSQDDDKVLDSEPMEDEGEKDEPPAETESSSASKAVSEDGKESQEKETEEKGTESKEETLEGYGVESEKKQGTSDGEADSKDQLSDSQEMWMQYDGEDLLETMVSDEDSEKQNQVDGTNVEKSDKPATGLDEAMEVDSDAAVKVTEQSQEADKKDSQEKSDDKEPGQNVDEADIIDMIEDRTVSPLLKEKLSTSKGTTDKTSEVKSVTQGQEKPSCDVVVIDDESTKDDAKPPEGDTTGESTEEGDKSKDSSLSSSEDKRRRSGGISISSIVSRLTQNLSEKKPEKEDVKPTSDKSMPVITQVKTLAQDPPKEKVGRKQVYKKEDVLNRCSQCFNPFLSLNPIKHGNLSFCSTECLKKKTGMSADSLACTYCKTAFQANSTDSCTLKVGTSQKSFCSETCKSDYQKRAKPCSSCGEDISGTNNSFMAQVGDEGKFMEFCSQHCVETYEKKLKDQPPPAKKDSSEKKVCSMCQKMTLIKHEVKFRGSYFHMCGPECFANFRRKNNLSLRTCNQCGTTCYNEHSPGEEKDGHKVFFCSQKCLEVFQHSRALSEPCFSCKTMYKQGMLIEGKASNGKIYKFCSQDCMKKGLPGTTASTPGETLSNSAKMKTTNVVSVQGPRMATQVQVANVKPVVQPKVVQPSGTDPATPTQSQGLIPCNHCKKVQRPLYHLTMSDSSLRNFCSYPCVIAFQAQFNVPPVTLPQETLLLRCGQCQRGFSHRPKTLDYQGETRLFCAANCLEDFKRTQSVIAICDCCFEEKILFEETNFLGKARYFCSPGCSLIFKNQFVKRIGLRCAMCDYCSTMCKVATVSVLGGIKKRFCGDECKESYNQWYNRMARCEGCKRMGCELTESFRWRGKVKRVCNEQCLLLFYTQQNVPDMGTQLQSELNPVDKPTVNGVGSVGIPTITNVKSLAGPTNSSDAPTQPKNPMAHKQTQITTNTIFVKPPPPPPTPPPPAPKQVKNKITLCKPYAVSKSITCKPITKNAETQSDFQPIFVPVPVPIYIPVPMQMYTTPVPQPMPIPIPVPTPMFVPVAYSNCDQLMESIEEVRNTIPSDPLEADILMMATAIAGKEESTRKPPPPIEPPSSPPEDISDFLPLEEGEVPDLPNKFLEGDSDIAGMLVEGLETLDSSDLFPEERVTRSASSRTTRNSTQGVDDSEPTTSRRSRTRGAKKVCLEALDDTESSPSPESVKEDVRPDIGPFAYSFYLQQMEKLEPADEKLKANLTLASVDELHYCLCRFVKEARQPDGEMYSADTLYLILLSIQKYLMTNKRKENIFMDPYFVTFSNLLHERLAQHTIITDPMADMSISSTCLDEEFLWESKQLGAHSPSVLLSTILYYCTKELMLKTVQMHKDLAFNRVQRLVRKNSKGQRIAYVRFVPSPENSDKDASGKGRKRPLDIDYSLELSLNTKIPLRCPIKLHEFYLSKCPESVKTSKKSFYLVPERACVPDSPLWYSDKPMPDKMIERYLYRHLMVKDVHEYWEMMRLKKEEGDDSSSDEED